jgi:hypothetical protein
MRKVLLALSVALLPVLAQAEDVYRWQDERGVVHYSNIEGNAPAGAAVVETPITLEVEHLPGATAEPVFSMSDGIAVDSFNTLGDGFYSGYAAQAPGHRQWYPDAPRIYDDARLRFGLFSAGALYFGGFSHADDISPNLNVYAFTLGPEAWLNTARAELAMRQNGINPRDMMKLYMESQR